MVALPGVLLALSPQMAHQPSVAAARAAARAALPLGAQVARSRRAAACPTGARKGLNRQIADHHLATAKADHSLGAPLAHSPLTARGFLPAVVKAAPPLGARLIQKQEVKAVGL